MNERKSIAEHIQSLARTTGAPGSFIEQVQALFVTKGISLDEDVAPFLDALDEAFRREETIRAQPQRAREDMERVTDSFRRAGQAYVERVSNLERQHDEVQDRRRLVRHVGAGPAAGTTRVTVRGSHRALVTRPVRENQPLVPGPKELQ